MNLAHVVPHYIPQWETIRKKVQFREATTQSIKSTVFFKVFFKRSSFDGACGVTENLKKMLISTFEVIVQPLLESRL